MIFSDLSLPAHLMTAGCQQKLIKESRELGMGSERQNCGNVLVRAYHHHAASGTVYAA
ncbi:hypothetical protein N9359_04175 [Luminiphilus sp.]|nr:hypothetical protein [Luminiphilus sp.]